MRLLTAVPKIPRYEDLNISYTSKEAELIILPFLVHFIVISGCPWTMQVRLTTAFTVLLSVVCVDLILTSGALKPKVNTQEKYIHKN